MKDDIDIEGELRKYHSDPSPHVKRSVLERFRRKYRGGNAFMRLLGLWKNPVPVYIVAAVVIMAAFAAFLAGQRSSRLQPRRTTLQAPLEREALSLSELEYEIAQSDLF
jgi:hypothetical protein